jgi:hypothetical protein
VVYSLSASIPYYGQAFLLGESRENAHSARFDGLTVQSLFEGRRHEEKIRLCMYASKDLVIEFGSAFPEFLRLFLQPDVDGVLLGHALLRRILPHVLRDFHGTEVGAAH